MAKVLTQAALDNFKPSAQRREIPDAKVSGLQYVLQPSGAASWAFRFRWGGKTAKLTIGPYPALGLAQARDLARKAAADLAGGTDPRAKKQAQRAAEAPADDLIEMVVERYIRDAKKKLRPRSWQQAEYMLASVVASLGKRRLSEIRRRELIALLDDIAERAPVTANRVLAHFRAMCSWALERELIEANPAAKIKPPGGPERSRERVLDDDELRALWTAAETTDYPTQPIIKLLVLTGARLREVMEMSWSEVDLVKETWTLPAVRAKNGVEHTVPLSTSALAIFKALPRFDRCDFVFTFKSKTPVTSMTRAKRSIDRAMMAQAPWTLHDIRRTVATGLQTLGVRLEVTEAVLNHVGGSRGGIVGIYQRHEYAEEKRAALDAWALALDQAVAGASAERLKALRAHALQFVTRLRGTPEEQRTATEKWLKDLDVTGAAASNVLEMAQAATKRLA